MKTVLEASRCHTLDRHNWKAQGDVCGNVDNKIWRQAVNSNFTLDHWPYMNTNNETKECIERLSMNSLQNMSKSGAHYFLLSLLVLNVYLFAFV